MKQHWKYTAQEDIDIILKYFGDDCKAWAAVGSRMTSSEVREDSDHDFLVLVGEDSVGEWMGQLALDNPSAHYRPENNEFNSWRDEDGNNFIVTYDTTFFMKFQIATLEAIKKNLTKKEDRVSLFQKILYKVTMDEEIPF